MLYRYRTATFPRSVLGSGDFPFQDSISFKQAVLIWLCLSDARVVIFNLFKRSFLFSTLENVFSNLLSCWDHLSGAVLSACSSLFCCSGAPIVI